MREFDEERMIDFFGDIDFVLEGDKFFLLNLNLIFGFLFGMIIFWVILMERFFDELNGVELAISVASSQVYFTESTDS